MARISNIKGALLEEAILWLLEESGYATVHQIPNIKRLDPYLDNAHNGICILGRGEKHQIDAIADYIFSPPFSNPLRLLCEAKYRESTIVGLETIRNAVGVKKDVEEFFRPNTRNPSYRYHYQYVVVSSTGFTKNAQNYAYAQDIYLIDLNSEVYRTSILDVIDMAVKVFVIVPLEEEGYKIKWNTNIKIDLANLRKAFRELL